MKCIQQPSLRTFTSHVYFKNLSDLRACVCIWPSQKYTFCKKYMQCRLTIIRIANIENIVSLVCGDYKYTKPSTNKTELSSRRLAASFSATTNVCTIYLLVIMKHQQPWLHHFTGEMGFEIFSCWLGKNIYTYQATHVTHALYIHSS